MTRHWSESDRDSDGPAFYVGNDPARLSHPRPALPPTCQFCGGIGHNESKEWHGWHGVVSWTDIAQRHAAELRRLSNDLRRNLGAPPTSSLGIARSSRADAYEWVADRLEKDAEEG